MTNDDHYTRTDITMGRLRELLQHEKDNQALRVVNAEMLAALKLICEVIGEPSSVIDAAQAAIAKAEGQ